MMTGETGQGHEVTGTRSVFEGRIISVFLDEVRLPDGRATRWERVAHPGAVGVVPLLPDGSVLMVRQFRNAVGSELLEIPAGKLDRPESPESCARRELVEEVGQRAGNLVKLAEFFNSPGFSDEYFHLYLATGLEPEKGETEEDEFIEVESYRLDDLVGMIGAGRITDAKSIIGVSLAKLFLAGEIEGMDGGCG